MYINMQKQPLNIRIPRYYTSIYRHFDYILLQMNLRLDNFGRLWYDLIGALHVLMRTFITHRRKCGMESARDALRCVGRICVCVTLSRRAFGVHANIIRVSPLQAVQTHCAWTTQPQYPLRVVEWGTSIRRVWWNRKDRHCVTCTAMSAADSSAWTNGQCALS